MGVNVIVKIIISMAVFKVDVTVQTVNEGFEQIAVLKVWRKLQAIGTVEEHRFAPGRELCICNISD